METFVHLEPKLQPDDLVSIEAELPREVSIERLSMDDLPADWASSRDDSLHAFGDHWISAGQTAALQVPSAAIRGEWNILLNPAHARFSAIRGGDPLPFRFDFRMFR